MRSIYSKVILALYCAAIIGGVDAHAAYPDRPVHLIVQFAPGGGNDRLARFLAQKLSEKWGQSVVVENREGANGIIAEDMTAHAPPDGYTVVLVGNSHTISPSQMKLNYDPIKDFAPITLLSENPDLLLVNPSFLKVNSTKEFIALAKSKPGKLNFGSPGTSSINYLQMAVFIDRADINLVNISYKAGGAAVITALLGGEVESYFGSISATGEYVKTGKFKALAVSGKRRDPSFPDVPTVAESADLPGFNETAWEGLLAPGGTPKEIVAKLHDDIVASMKMPDFQKFLVNGGWDAVGNTPEEFSSFIREDIVKWEKLLKKINAKPQQ